MIYYWPNPETHTPRINPIVHSMTKPVLAHPLIAELFAPHQIQRHEANPYGKGHNLRYGSEQLTDKQPAAEMMKKFENLPTICSRSIYGNVFIYSNGRWRCVRHSQPDEVLSAENPETTCELTVEQKPGGRYFGNFGFVHGPGFKAFAKDFPEGTKIVVTATLIPPSEPSA